MEVVHDCQIEKGMVGPSTFGMIHRGLGLGLGRDNFLLCLVGLCYLLSISEPYSPLLCLFDADLSTSARHGS